MNKVFIVTLLSIMCLTSLINCEYFVTSVAASCGGAVWYDIYETTSCHYLGNAYYYYDCGGQIVKYDCQDENCEDCVKSATFNANQCVYGIEFSCSSSSTVKVPAGYIGELSYNGTSGCNNSPYWATIIPKNTCINESPYLSQIYKCNGAEVDFYTCTQPNCPTSNSQACTKVAMQIGCFSANSTSIYEQVECN